MATINEYPPPLGDKRVVALDIARFYGMVLVYYGHIIEQVMNLGYATAAMQYKFIYSFHMPFFFLVAGYVAKPEKLFLKAGAFFRRLVASRIIPYFFFSLVFMLLSIVIPGNFVALGPPPYTLQAYAAGVVRTLLGFPVFNIPMWFMASLVSVEVLHYFVGRHMRTNRRIVLAAVCFYLIGYYINLDFQFLQFDKLFRWNYWFIQEAPVGYAFYLVGILLRRRGVFFVNHSEQEKRAGSRKLLLGAAACCLIVWLTYNLNTGPFRYFDAVVIVLSAHGNVFWFPFTALVGSMMLLLLARASGENRVLAFMGRNVLILFILNGVFYHFLNIPFAKWIVGSLPANALVVTLATAVLTALSLAACLPLVWFFNKYLPQVVGRPQKDGPLLPRLI